jgi:hypothetical protein
MSCTAIEGWRSRARVSGIYGAKEAVMMVVVIMVMFVGLIVRESRGWWVVDGGCDCDCGNGNGNRRG